MKLGKKIGFFLLLLLAIVHSSPLMCHRTARVSTRRSVHSVGRHGGWSRGRSSWSGRHTRHRYRRRPYWGSYYTPAWGPYWGYYSYPYYWDYGPYGGTGFGFNFYI